METRCTKPRALCLAFALAVTVFRPTTPALSAPASPAATITVDSNLDWADILAPDSTEDGVCNDRVTVSGIPGLPDVYVCTLRSAIKTAGETNGPDTVVFAPSLSNAVIALKQGPILWAASNVTVTGIGQNIVISGAAMDPGRNMIEISGSGNTLTGLSMTGANVSSAVVVEAGNDNIVESMAFYRNYFGGVFVTGSGTGNIVRNSAFGQPVLGPLCETWRANRQNIVVSHGPERTLIEGNGIYCATDVGVYVRSSTTETTVRNNRIGVGMAGQTWGNWEGVVLEDARRVRLEGNIVGSNRGSGIFVFGSSEDIRISNNQIGDIERPAPIGLRGENGADGVVFENVQQANATIDNNDILGNGRDGVRIEGSSAITVSNNLIGYADRSANAKNSNGVYVGPAISGGSSEYVYVLTNTIGYNENVGVLITGDSRRTGVAGNTIVGQGDTGVRIDGGARDNVIGARAHGPSGLVGVSGNTIISNTNHGVYIAGASTINNLVVANQIGQQGANSYPNGQNGIVLDNTHNNVIGGDGGVVNLRNTIVNNGEHGILITDGADNLIIGNDIGFSPALTASNGAAGNRGSGIRVQGASTGNQIGGTVAGEANRVSHNGGEGLTLSGAGVTSNTIGGNLIRRNGGHGIGIYGALTNTFAGGGGAGDYILTVSRNARTGVYVAANANNNVLMHADLSSNLHYGLLIDGSTGISVSNVYLYNNGYDGIGERNGATNNTWQLLETASNGGLGIDKDASADNTDIVAASTVTITAYDDSSGQMSISGLTPNTSYEVYLADPDPSGYGEGARVLAVFSTGAGQTSASVTIPPADRTASCFTVLRNTAPSSEFSQNYCRLRPQTINAAPVADRTMAQPLTFTVSASATSGLPVAFTGLTTAVCTVDAGGVATIITTGTCTMRLDQPGDGTFGPAAPVTVTFNVTRAAQTINFPQPGPVNVNRDTQLSATASSGLTVTFSGGTAGVCAVSATGLVTPLGIGDCTVTATQPGDANYAAAPPVTRTFNVRRPVYLPFVRKG